MKVINYDEYGQLICHWFKKEFYNVAEISDKDLLEILAHLIVSTKENRYGPLPLPEQLVEIRKVIRKAIETNTSIPILIAWGGRKPDLRQSIDMAEVFALKQLIQLDVEIKKYYAPGLLMNIRIEDLGADWLYREQEGSERAVEKYSSDFVKLVYILSGSTQLRPIRESRLMDKQTYFTKSAIYSNLLYTVITKQIAYPGLNVNDIPEYQELVRLGWKGEIVKEQRDYYICRYKSLYPDLPDSDHVKMLADYFGGSKARYDMNGRAEPKTEIGDYLSLSFVAPIPGAPINLFNKTVYWRTMPMAQGRTHIAPWRAKGFFKVTGNEAIGKITSFSDPIVQDMLMSTTLLQKDGETLAVTSDYILV